MKVTPQLKAWLIENCGAKKDATDEDYRMAAGIAMAEGKLSPEKFAELTADKDAEKADEISNKLDAVLTSFGKLTEVLAKQHEKPDPTPDSKPELETKEVKETGVKKVIAEQGNTEEGKSPEVRVKAAKEQYSTTTKAMVYPDRTNKGQPHAFAGQPVKHLGRTLNEPSELDAAYAGAFAKWQIHSAMRKSPSLGFNALTEHEKDLLSDLAENGMWDSSTKIGHPESRKGYVDEFNRRGIKALIDDSTSGGLEAAPIVFDDQVISAPLLYGELFPLVNVVSLDRGRRVEGVAVGNVTASWGGVDDTSVALFNTASYVSAFDTTIYRWEGAVQIGLDFLSDTPIDFGSFITAQYGERLLEDLDDVVAVGNGTTQPEGIMNKVGTTTVAWGGATSIGNYESLRFSVHKREHKANLKSTIVFCGTETSYQRARALNVGAADARRLFGYTYDDYMLMQRSYKINESLTNAQIFYAILGRYRMYRRKGLAIRTSTEGDTLIRKNELLIVAMARFGGQLERGACAGKTTTAPA